VIDSHATSFQHIDSRVTLFQHTEVLLIFMVPHSIILMCYWF